MGNQTSFTEGSGQTFFHQWGEGQIFYTRGGWDKDFILEMMLTADVYGEEDVSKAKILLSEGDMLSVGARIFRGPQGSKILVSLYLEFRTAHF